MTKPYTEITAEHLVVYSGGYNDPLKQMFSTEQKLYYNKVITVVPPGTLLELLHV